MEIGEVSNILANEGEQTYQNVFGFTTRGHLAIRLKQAVAGANLAGDKLRIPACKSHGSAQEERSREEEDEKGKRKEGSRPAMSQAIRSSASFTTPLISHASLALHPLALNDNTHVSPVRWFFTSMSP